MCVLAMGAVSVTVEVSSGMGSDVRGRRDNRCASDVTGVCVVT